MHCHCQAAAGCASYSAGQLARVATQSRPRGVAGLKSHLRASLSLPLMSTLAVAGGLASSGAPAPRALISLTRATAIPVPHW